MSTDRHGMAVLDTRTCLDLLRTVEVGRIAVSGEYPEILPVNFVVDHGAVVFRTADGTKLDALCREPNVTFEADGADGGSVWSVVVKGHAVVLADPRDRVAALDLPLSPWHDAPKQHIVRIDPVEISGRRFAVTGRPDP